MLRRCCGCDGNACILIVFDGPGCQSGVTVIFPGYTIMQKRDPYTDLIHAESVHRGHNLSAKCGIDACRCFCAVCRRRGRPVGSNG